MIEKIVDESNDLLHMVYRPDIETRTDIVDPSQFIQVAYMIQSEGQYFKPHRHIERNVPYESVITQETWIVIKGRVEASYFDRFNSLITCTVLNPGDCTITLGGGHSYKSLDDNTLVYEIKNGPYVGRDNDKEYFSE